MKLYFIFVKCFSPQCRRSLEEVHDYLNINVSHRLPVLRTQRLGRTRWMNYEHTRPRKEICHSKRHSQITQFGTFRDSCHGPRVLHGLFPMGSSRSTSSVVLTPFTSSKCRRLYKWLEIFHTLTGLLTCLLVCWNCGNTNSNTLLLFVFKCGCPL